MNMDGIDGRISKVEAGHDRLHEDVQSLYVRMDKGFSSLRDDIKSLSRPQKTQWSVIIAGIGVMITIMVLAFAPLIYMSQGNKDAVQRHEDMLLSIIGKSAITSTNLEHAAENLVRLDTVLQREMRLLDDTVHQKIKGLDVRLQQEMRLLDAAAEAKLGFMDKRVSVTEQWMREHDKRVVGLNAAQWERIKGLERQVYGKQINAGVGAALGAD